jgi:hypothetical protein
MWKASKKMTSWIVALYGTSEYRQVFYDFPISAGLNSEPSIIAVIVHPIGFYHNVKRFVYNKSLPNVL